MMRPIVQAQISQTAVTWILTLARQYEVPVSTFNDMSGSDLVREIAAMRWKSIIEMAHDARRGESKERVKKLDELYYGERDAKLAWHLVKLLDEGDKELEKRVKDRKQAERARKRESWQKGRR